MEPNADLSNDNFTFTQPPHQGLKRTAKACSSCRRDKVRCDGGRPCSNCLKKGYSPDKCVDGCEPCRRARARCEEGKPCKRCLEQRLECVDEPTMLLVNPGDMRTNRTYQDRAKLACANCRRDNKKCDDQRPCSRCVARHEDCVHVGRGPKLVKLRCEECRQKNKRCEDARPCKFCVESQVTCLTSPRKGRGHGTRVKAACTNCRRDKIRCDGQRPCAACQRRGFECIERPCQSCMRIGIGDQCTHRILAAQEPPDPAQAMQQTIPMQIAHPSFLNTQHLGPPPPQLLYNSAAPNGQQGPPIFFTFPPPGDPNAGPNTGIAPHLIYIPIHPDQNPLPPHHLIAGPNGPMYIAVVDPRTAPEGSFPQLSPEDIQRAQQNQGPSHQEDHSNGMSEPPTTIAPRDATISRPPPLEAATTMSPLDATTRPSHHEQAAS